MKLIVGLGNPGPQYELTRHNAGFLVLDKLAQEFSISWETKDKLGGEIGKGTIFGQQVILLKPQTYMNLSGKSVAQCLRFFKIDPTQVVVLFDDIDLDFGKVKSRLDGGHGGHNGIRSMISELGSDQFARVKLGIGRPDHAKASVANWVLAPMSDAELSVLLNEMYQDAYLRLKNVMEAK